MIAEARENLTWPNGGKVVRNGVGYDAKVFEYRTGPSSTKKNARRIARGGLVWWFAADPFA